MQRSQSSFRSAILGIALSIATMASGCSKSEPSGNPSGGSPISAGNKTSTPMTSGGASASTGGAGGIKASASSGGAIANGGSTPISSAGGSCPAATACGGDLVGTWTVISSCLRVSGELDMSMVGAGCKTAPVTGSLQVSGTFTANANRTYVDKTITTGQEQFTLEPSCLIISSTPTDCNGAAGLLTAVLGFTELECTPAAGGGCNCTGQVNQSGTMGIPYISYSTDGSYKIAGNVVTMDDQIDYSYCVADDKLTMIPKPANPTFTGSIVLQKSSGTSTGGATGSGGPITGGSRSGGATASGGTTLSGGSRSGGATASGGTTLSGGSRSGGTPSSGGTTSSGGATAGATGTGTGPCDIYAANGTPCVAAHSVVRALFGGYRGRLYQINRTDGATLDILTGPDGIADTGPEDTFCNNSSCNLTIIYDQTKNANDLWWQGSEMVPAPKSSTPAKATTDPVKVGGHKVYSAFIRPGNCYWHDGSKSGMPKDAEPEGMYMVSSARNTNGGCCFDYGNSETTRSADVGGAMDAINVSSITAWGTGAGKGPWILADMEWGLFCQADNKNCPNNPTQTAPFLTAMLKNNGTTEYALKGGDASSGPLQTIYKGRGPYNPMKKQGAIILGCGGDCCKPCAGCGSNASSGIFYEGAIVKGYPSDETENLVQANIVSVGYGK